MSYNGFYYDIDGTLKYTKKKRWVKKTNVPCIKCKKISKDMCKDMCIPCYRKKRYEESKVTIKRHHIIIIKK